MAGKTPMEKFKLLQDEVARLGEKTGDGLPPELQTMLKELGSLSEMKKELQSPTNGYVPPVLPAK